MVAKKKAASRKKASTKKRPTAKRATRADIVAPVGPQQQCGSKSCNDWSSKSGGGFIWFTGFVGAAVYYLSMATCFWSGVLGILKAIVWPAMLVFKLLGM